MSTVHQHDLGRWEVSSQGKQMCDGRVLQGEGVGRWGGRERGGEGGGRGGEGERRGGRGLDICHVSGTILYNCIIATCINRGTGTRPSGCGIRSIN